MRSSTLPSQIFFKKTILSLLHPLCLKLSTWMLHILGLWIAGATRWPAASFPPISYPMMTGEQLPKCCQQQQLALVKSAEHTDALLAKLCGVIALLHCSGSMWWHLSPDTLHLLGLVSLSFSYNTSHNIGVDCIKGWFSQQSHHNWLEIGWFGVLVATLITGNAEILILIRGQSAGQTAPQCKHFSGQM